MGEDDPSDLWNELDFLDQAEAQRWMELDFLPFLAVSGPGFLRMLSGMAILPMS